MVENIINLSGREIYHFFISNKLQSLKTESFFNMRVARKRDYLSNCIYLIVMIVENGTLFVESLGV